jgi:hypothetical protein
VKNIESHCDIRLKAEGVYYAVLIHTESVLNLAARLLVGGAESPAYIKRGFATRAGITDDLRIEQPESFHKCYGLQIVGTVARRVDCFGAFVTLLNVTSCQGLL